MNKISLFLLFVISSYQVFSQGFITAKDVKFDLSGFVRNDFIFDSRRNVDACDQLFEMFPQKPVYDSNGEDINAQPSVKMINTFTRFGTRFSGLEIGEAKIGAYVEFDFTAGSQMAALRLRHAYTQFVWPKTKLLFGRTWHPTFIEKVYPITLNENTGLPFQAFNRSPQLRITYQLTSKLDFIAAAVYQFDYSNGGPDGKTYKYQRDAVVPNLHGQLQFYNSNWIAGVAYDWKMIQPRTVTSGTTGSFKTNEKLSTYSALAYLKYSNKKFLFMAKSMFGQNVCESLLPSGYAVSSRDPLTGAETYTPFNHIYNWVNISYGVKWKVALYAGYLKNYGTSDAKVVEIYGFGTDADAMYKISPLLIYTYKNFNFGAELSWTTTAYGDNDKADYARVKNAQNVTNFRNMLSVIYNF